MFFTAELTFFRRVLNNSHIDTAILAENQPLPEKLDKGLRKFLELEEDYLQMFADLWKKLNPNTIYKISDSFFCCYIAMVLPETKDNTVLIAGPYVNTEITRQMLMEAAEKHSIPTQHVSYLDKYFGNIPVVSDERNVMTLCNTFGETIWRSNDNFSVEYIENLMSDKVATDAINAFKAKSDDPLLAIQMLEERYAAESQMMQAVALGKSHKVEQIFSNASSLVFEKRTEDPVRNMKNYLIISNTLLRKAAEQGSVHPFYIDGISSDFARKIEQVRSVTEAGDLIKRMFRKYCNLVKNHSMKDYSLLVQKIITIIDSDLTADLSLKKFADLLNVNASYLSSLFKKETGKNLTEYVSQKRIEHAEFLLKTTKLQIQTVAQHCGIYDVNYFTKTFKKYTGKTPKEFRKDL